MTKPLFLFSAGFFCHDVNQEERKCRSPFTAFTPGKMLYWICFLMNHSFIQSSIFQLDRAPQKTIWPWDTVSLGAGGTPAAFAVAKVLSDVIAQRLLSLLILLLFAWFCSLELWLVNRNWEVDFWFFEFVSPCSRGVVIVGMDNSYDMAFYFFWKI